MRVIVEFGKRHHDLLLAQLRSAKGGFGWRSRGPNASVRIALAVGDSA